MPNVPVGTRLVAQVDVEDYEAASAYAWSPLLSGSRLVTYAYSVELKKYMHNWLTGIKPVDHADGDGLNNHRSNLRAGGGYRNAANSSRRTRQSGYKGVTQNRSRGIRYDRWSAVICKDGKKTHLGSFSSPELAARAYNVAALKYFGEYAKLNEEGG
jgi:hypothetical protein